MAFINYEWFVNTAHFTDYELQEELKRLNDAGFEIFSVISVADFPEDDNGKFTIVARKEII